MPTYRQTFQGTLHGTELFQYGFAVTGAGNIAQAATAGAAAHTAFTGASGVLGLFHTSVVWSQLTTSQIPDGGGVVIVSATTAISGTGTDAGGPIPNQCAICISILTGLAGSRNRGRFYLPPPASSELSTTARFASGSRTTLAAGLTAMNTSLESNGFSIVVVSPSQSANIAATSLRIGDVIDTQRSRRNDLAEVYTTVAI